MHSNLPSTEGGGGNSGRVAQPLLRGSGHPSSLRQTGSALKAPSQPQKATSRGHSHEGQLRGCHNPSKTSKVPPEPFLRPGTRRLQGVQSNTTDLKSHNPIQGRLKGYPSAKDFILFESSKRQSQTCPTPGRYLGSPTLPKSALILWSLTFCEASPQRRPEED